MNYQNKILHSGIFKLNKSGNPVGLMALEKAGLYSKELSDQSIPHSRKELTRLISSLASSIESYQEPFDLEKILKTIPAPLDGSPHPLENFDSYLRSLVPLPKGVRTAYSQLLKGLKVMTLKRLKTKPKPPRDSKGRSRAQLANSLIKMFLEHTQFKYGLSDSLRYLSYVLSSCAVEKGTPQEVYHRLNKARSRSKKVTKKPLR